MLNSMLEKNLVTIIISTYNEPIFMVQESIRSILKQSYTNLQIILINDNPKRNDLLELLSDYSRLDARINYIINEKNIGLVQSLNKGIQIAKGKYIARMDADDISMFDRIQKQIEYLEKNDLDLIGCNITKINETGNCVGELSLPSTNKMIVKYMKYGSCVLHPTWLGKAEVFKQLGGYRNIYSCEDFDFLIRAIEYGYKLGNLPENKLLYRVRANSISNTSNIRQKLLTYYLVESYKKNRNVSIEKINQYLSSSKYRSDYKELEKYFQSKEYVKNSSSIIQIIKSSFYILSNKYFYKNIIEHIKLIERKKYSRYV